MQPILTDSLRRAERLFGRKEGVVCGEVRLTYAEFGSRRRRLASALRRMGVSKGDRVAVLMDNGHRYLEAYSAIPGIGAAIVPLNTRHSIQEHRAILADCGTRVLVADEAHRHVANEVDIEEVLLAPGDYERLVATSAEAELGEGVGEEDLAGLFYTKGTTGAAKGVMLTHRNLVANAFHITIGFAYEEDDTFLHSAPMFHLADGSSIYALTWLGARHVFVSAFEPGAVLETIAHEGVNCTILVPTMIGALVNHSDAATADLSSLRLIPHGGAPIATGLLRCASAVLDCSFTQAYGLTESSSFATVLPQEERLLDDARLRSAGRPAMGVELAVRRPDATVCEPDEVGEITLRGPNVTRGYWNNPRESAEVLSDGWFWTGDLARADEESYVYIVDRKKDMCECRAHPVHHRGHVYLLSASLPHFENKPETRNSEPTYRHLYGSGVGAR